MAMSFMSARLFKPCRSFSPLLRSYSSAVPPAPPSSKPTQVVLRRTQDATLDLDQDKLRYDSLLAKGDLISQDGSVPSYDDWLEKTNKRRRRIRGVRTRTEDEQVVTEQVVGRRIYLPNITFRLMRNHTPQGKPYNPYEATFRIPQSVTKLDVRAYLKALYGVECTYIRTDNYIAPIERDVKRGNQKRRVRGKDRTYKRAVVGLVQPFVYPDAIEDMPSKERQERQEWLDEMFQIDVAKEHSRQARIGLFTGNWRGFRGVNTKRSTILENVMKRRAERENLVKEAAKDLALSGASPFGPGSVQPNAKAVDA